MFIQIKNSLTSCRTFEKKKSLAVLRLKNKYKTAKTLKYYMLTNYHSHYSLCQNFIKILFEPNVNLR